MEILITGTGKSGSSWSIRGEQLGQAIGAHVIPMATRSDCLNADVVVVVKRARGDIIAPVLESRRPWVWDVVDAWPQPVGRSMTKTEAIAWIRGELRRLMPTAVVWPTAKMGVDATWTGRQIYLPHHGWERYAPRELREHVEVVGYEGGRHYLGRWARLVQEQCDLRGWRFEINGDLSNADIGLALRDAGGYPAQHWKSNCKLANLQALGIPALCSPESGYQETATGGETWIREARDLVEAFDRLEAVESRRIARSAMLTTKTRLDPIARTYREWLFALAS